MTDLAAFIARQIAAAPVEAKIIRKVIRGAKAAGNPIVEVWDGEESTPVSTEKEVMMQVFNLDEAVLYTKSGAFIRLTMGEGYYVINDYNVSLDSIMDPISEWINAHDI